MYFGSRTSEATQASAGLNRSTWPTCSTSPCLRARFTSSSAAADVRGERLLDEQRHAAGEQFHADRMVRVGRRGDDRGVDFADQLAVIGDAPRLAVSAPPRRRGTRRRGRPPRRARFRRARRRCGRECGPRWPAANHGDTQRRHAALRDLSATAVAAFLLPFDEGQELVHLRHELSVAAQDFAGRVEADLARDTAADGPRPGSRSRAWKSRAA